MKKINVCLLERKRKVGFSFSLSQVTAPLGTLLLMVLWTEGLILQTPFGRGAVHIPSPSYQSQQHHCHQGTALGRSCRMKTPILPFMFWNKSPVREQITLCDPNGQNWRTSLEKWMNSSTDSVFIGSSAQASPNCPVQTVHKTTTEVFCTRMWLGETQGKRWDLSIHERAGTWMRCSQLLHGSGTMGCDIRATERRKQQNKNFGHGNLHYQCEQPAFLLHLRML